MFFERQTNNLADAVHEIRWVLNYLINQNTVEEVKEMLRNSGFQEIAVEPKDQSHEFIKDWEPGGYLEDYIQSAVIKAIKPYN
ncbi:hypothetical protein NYE69_07195 [Paenibacillus sp. FSL R5-0527]|uniref:hypothetical protein n=1 Tax=Paenibacillus sp. FSL R5-0527 TaxID=2975321 RepID=UPI00269B09A7